MPASGKSDIETMGNANTETSPQLHERKIICLLCLLAAVHVFIFSTAFPFFTNVDEPAQFDLVIKYSHGHLPHGKEMISPDSSVYLALFSSCAYMGTPDKFPDHRMPAPSWTKTAEKMRQDLAVTSVAWQAQNNYEISQAPLYYMLAGGWWHVGQWLGFHDGRLVYWLRFLNIGMIVALVLLGYAISRKLFPENLFLRLGVPTLLAFMPQTAFYSIGNDMLSSLCFGALFLCLLKWLSSENISWSLGAATGLAIAATALTKTTNLPLLAVTGTVLAFKIWQRLQRGKPAAALPGLAALLCCAVPPIIGWMLWCKYHFGDYTGSKLKMDNFGWTVKPFGEWWHHPIFTPIGIWTYLSGQLGTFWQGEFMWLNEPMALPGTDLIYTTLSLILVAVASPALLQRFSNVTPQQRQALQLSVACFVAALGFFALMSIIYDFHDCPNPSRDHPYFQAGRMILGALIPFLLLFIYGLDRILNRLGNTAKFATFGGLILAMLILETATNWRAFSNEYNWFHLP